MGVKRDFLTLTFAMGLRIFASLAYVVLVSLLLWQGKAEVAASFVYLMAVSFISSNFGRFGTDQHIAKSAPDFRKQQSNAAGNLLATHGVFSVTTVPILAVAIHLAADYFSAGRTISVSLTEVIACAAALSLAQTVSTAIQASGKPSASVLVFPLFTYLCAGVTSLLFPGWEVSSLWISLITCCIAGLSFLFYGWGLVFSRIDFSLLTGNSYFYVMGASFYVSTWLAYVYLPGLVSHNSMVTLNLAQRLSSIQSMPVNSISGYLMPRFAVDTAEGNYSRIERAVFHTIVVTLLFQLLFFVALILAHIYLKTSIPASTTELLPLLLILSLGQIFNGATGPVSPALLMLGHQRFLATVSASLCLFGVFAGYFAALYFGVLGFAVVASLIVGLQNVLYVWRLLRKTPIRPYRFFP